MKYLRVRLEPTSRTDLMCLSCGGFRTQLLVVPGPGLEPQVGVHKACLKAVKATRAGAKAPKVPVVRSVLEGEGSS
jgi:hypothetical protein